MQVIVRVFNFTRQYYFVNCVCNVYHINPWKTIQNLNGNANCSFNKEVGIILLVVHGTSHDVKVTSIQG